MSAHASKSTTNFVRQPFETRMSTLFIFFQGGGGFGLMVPMLLIFVVFYFLLIMPQKKRQRELQEKIANLKAGDRIVTTGGIIGKISEVRETSLLIRSADKSMLEIARSAVADLDREEEKKSS
ncbi:MAG: preprotein translocase subunit YajC [Blastocatellia bacterium]|jgi:preprotein translocase subunit YajC|nr:preprotein translocase subunit YajC [Blastocatellia bacterium]